MTQTPMLDFVLEQLNQTKIPLTTICAETGLGRSWLWQLKDGRIPDPSVRRIQVLWDYFVQNPKPCPLASSRGAPHPNGAATNGAPPNAAMESAATASGAAREVAGG